MKLTFILLTVALMQVSAKGLSQTISISGKDLQLETIFKEIKKQSGYVVFYNYDMLKDAKPVTITVKNSTVQEVMNQALKDQPLSYSIENRTIVLTRKTKPPTINDTDNNAPPIDVKGRVVNEKGEPLEGVTVTVKGTNRVTATDTNGDFVLRNINSDAVLSFTSVNTETLDVKVNGRTSLSIDLKTKVSELDGVRLSVNTGYQRVSKERYVGAFNTLDSTAYQMRAGASILSRLDGTMPGILFDKVEGSTALGKMHIRGFSTLISEQAPLIVVDNFPYRGEQNLDLINPNDVENVTILKDAAATSIWGALAGNGVIVIVTKKGRYNRPLSINVNTNVTVTSKPDQYYAPQMNVADFVDAEIFLFNKGFYNDVLTSTADWPVYSQVVRLLDDRRAGRISAADSAAMIDGFKSQDLRRDLDKYVYRPALLQQYYVNLSGGSNTVSYNFSAGYNHRLNNIQNSKPDKSFNINASGNFRPTKNLDISTGIVFTQEIAKSASFTNFGRTSPYAQLADNEGNALAVVYGRGSRYADTAGAGRLLDWKYRPLDEIRLVDREFISRLIQLNTSITYRFSNWLNATASYQFSTNPVHGSDYQGLETYATRDLINSYTNFNQTAPALRNPVPVGGIMIQQSREITTHNGRAQLNFDKSFSARHKVTAFVASDVSQTVITANSASYFGYDKDNGTYQPTIDYATLFPLYSGTVPRAVPNGNTRNPSRTSRAVSMSANASYSYNNRYILYVSARKDGANIFGAATNRKWNPLWSVGGSWDVSKEKFYSISWMPNLRAKFTYGYSGNPGNATALPVIDYFGFPTTLTNLPNAYPRYAPNPTLRWEKVGMINESIEFSLFKNRINGSLDVYQKKSTDLIWSYSAPLALGFQGELQRNIADTKTNGFELVINSQNLHGKLEWNTSFSLSHSQTIVTKLNNTNNFVNTAAAYAPNPSEGRMLYAMVSYKWGGLDAAGNPQGYYNGHLSTDYQSLLGDSISNQVFHGSAIPLYFGNISNSFGWKGFRLTANISYRLDFYFRKPSIVYREMASLWNGHSDYALRWQKPGDENITDVPSFTYPINNLRDQFYRYSEINVLRGDNIRLSDLRLDYRWNARAGNKLPIKSLAVFFNANNLNVILWRKNKAGIDPDYSGGINLTPPPAKSWTIGCNMSL